MTPPTGGAAKGAGVGKAAARHRTLVNNMAKQATFDGMTRGDAETAGDQTAGARIRVDTATTGDHNAQMLGGAAALPGSITTTAESETTPSSAAIPTGHLLAQKRSGAPSHQDSPKPGEEEVLVAGHASNKLASIAPPSNQQPTNITPTDHDPTCHSTNTLPTAPQILVLASETPTTNMAQSTPTDGAKSTTCASTTNPHFGTPNNSKGTPLLDETIMMTQAVETLQISHSTLPTTESPATTESPWKLVTNAQQKAPAILSSNSQEFGLAFERTTKGNNWSTDDLLLILQTIKAHDPKAMLSSADNKAKPTLATAILHKAQKDIPWFTKFTAMKTMTWGKPSDGTTKIVFSFWLTSTIIKKDLAQLRMDSDFTEMLKGTNTYMKVTKLHEPHSKIVGYFLGKDIVHTNRDDITH